MSVQSESGRLDYDKSDHSPRGTRMAGDVIKMPGESIESAMKGAAGQAGNERSWKGGFQNLDTTNLGAMPNLTDRVKKTMQNK